MKYLLLRMRVIQKCGDTT